MAFAGMRSLGVGDTNVVTTLFAMEGSATLVAVIVTVEGWGAVAGAVYRPLAEMVPSVAFPPVTPFTLQVTRVFELPLTVAVYCEELPKVTLVAPLRVSVTVGGGGGAAIVTTRLCATEGTATLVAVMVTFEVGGAVAGAV
jgi:hypothetical protein